MFLSMSIYPLEKPHEEVEDIFDSQFESDWEKKTDLPWAEWDKVGW